MSDSSDTSSVIFVAEQKTVPPPFKTKTLHLQILFLIPREKLTILQHLKIHSLLYQKLVSEFTIIFTNSTNCTNSTTNNIIKNYKP